MTKKNPVHITSPLSSRGLADGGFPDILKAPDVLHSSSGTTNISRRNTTRLSSPLTSRGLNDADLPNILKAPDVLRSPSEALKKKHILEGPNVLRPIEHNTNPYLR
jgi:hypothetical protein